MFFLSKWILPGKCYVKYSMKFYTGAISSFCKFTNKMGIGLRTSQKYTKIEKTYMHTYADLERELFVKNRKGRRFFYV